MIRIASLSEFHEVVKSHHGEWFRWYYRGHRRPEHRLIPKVGRPDFRDRDERAMFARWKLHAIAFVDRGPVDYSDWDWLAIAQHHGLATRFLDWTFNPLAAAFFALVDLASGKVEEDHDAVVCAHYSRQELRDERTRGPDPFEDRGIERVTPGSLVPRIGRQGGIFTVHGPPTLDLEEHLPPGDRVERVVIDKARKRDFAIELSHYGVNRMSMFPDLDGLSAHINWAFRYLRYD